MYNSLRAWFPTGATVHVRLSLRSALVPSFGCSEEIITREFVERDAVNDRAQLMHRIYSMDKKVYMDAVADGEDETLLVKMRLYEFEELAQKCGWTDFIRISNTDIVNFSKVTNLDLSLTGIVRVNFTNGKAAIVSRRYMSKIKKELLNMKYR